MHEVLVTRKDNDFVIKNLITGETVTINSSQFYGGNFKYKSEFFQKFQTASNNREINNDNLSKEASAYMADIIAFNRIDN